MNMHLKKVLVWTTICIFLLLVLLTSVDTILGKLTLYLLVGFFLTSLFYVRSKLYDPRLFTKFRLTEQFFTKSESQTIDWSPYLPPIPESLAFESSNLTIDKEVATFADKLTENYISSWFKYIGEDPRFAHDVRHIIHAALYKLITLYLPCIKVNILIADIIQVLNCHLRGIDCGRLGSLERREQLLSHVAHWLISDLGPRELIALKCVKCSREQRRDASFHILKKIISHGALANVVDMLSEPQLITSSIMKLVDDSYSRKEEIKRIYLERADSTSDSVESAPPVIPRIVISNASSSREQTMRQDSHSEEAAASSQLSTRTEGNSSILKSITGKLRLPLSIEQALSLNRSRALAGGVSGVERGVEVTEHSGDLKLISNVRIGDAKETTSQGDNYIIFKIVYDGLFEEIEADVNSFKPVLSTIVRREVVVWHRFSAFVELHKQLCKDRKMELLLKQIRSPSKLKTLFESKVEPAITRKRCEFLTDYLKKLSNISVICNCRSFRTFMGYGQDCDEASNVSEHRLAMDASSNSQLGARLERIVSGGLKNVVTAMKRVLPSDTYQEGLLASFLSPSICKRIVVSTRIGYFTDFDERLRLVDSMDSYCFLFPLKDEVSTSYDVTPSPSPLSASLSTRCSYLTPQSAACDKSRRVKMSEPLVDLMALLVTQSTETTWWAFAAKVVLTDVVESYLNAVKRLVLDKVSIACLFNLLHSTVWPDDCVIAEEEDGEDGEDEQDVRGEEARDNDARLPRDQCARDKSVLDRIDKYTCLLDLLCVDHHSIVPFLMEKFSCKDANVTLIYNLINVCFARLTLDCSNSSQVSRVS